MATLLNFCGRQRATDLGPSDGKAPALRLSIDAKTLGYTPLAKPDLRGRVAPVLFEARLRRPGCGNFHTKTEEIERR